MFRAIPLHGMFCIEGPGNFMLYVGDEADLANALAQVFCAATMNGPLIEPSGFSFSTSHIAAMDALRRALIPCTP